MEREWMARLVKKEMAIRLIRDQLGCTCPSEVFDHFQIRYCESRYSPFVQMIMGDRLLVRIIEISRLNSPDEEIPAMLSEGLEERETRGLNRFRLVMVGSPPPELMEDLMKISEKMDAKIHLHSLPPESLTG